MKLKDICSKIGSGATPRGGKEAYKESGVPIIRSQNVLDWSFNTDGLAYIDDNQASALANVEVKPGDVLLNITGDSVARACIVPNVITPARVNQHVLILRANYKTNPVFLLTWLQSNKSLLLALASSGATRNALTKTMLEELDINLPPVDVQFRIAEIVSSIQAKIEANTRLNGYLEELLLAKYDELFPKSSPYNGTLAEAGEIIGGATPSKKRPEYYCHSGLGWITPRDLSNTSDKFVSHGSDDITKAGYDSCSTTLMPKGSILFSSRAPIGYVAIASDEVATNQGFKSVVPNKAIGTAFVYCFLVRNKQRIADMGAGTTFPEVSRKMMQSVELHIPSLEACKGFSEFAEPLLSQQYALEKESHSLASLRDTLLPRLMSGEIDVSEISLTQLNSHLGDC